MRKYTWVLIAVLALAVAAPASADVVIHFTSGKTLPARNVKYVGDMVQVDLGGDGIIAFPRAAIEKVEVPERPLNLEKNSALAGRQSGTMIAGKTEAAGKRKGGSSTIKTRRNPGISASTRQQLDKNGLAVTNAVPFASSYAATRLKNVTAPDPQAARHNNVSGGGSIRGTHRAGGRYVMAGDQVPNRPKPVPIRLNGAAEPTPAPPPERTPPPEKD